jgi:hypothetical protein
MKNTKEETPYVDPSDALAAALVADPRYQALMGAVMRNCGSWTAQTPEVGYGLLQGVIRTFAYLEERGVVGTIELLKPPTELPKGFAPQTSGDLDGMDA